MDRQMKRQFLALLATVTFFSAPLWAGFLSTGTKVEAANLSVSNITGQSSGVTLSATVTDGVGGTLSYSVLTQPAHGILTGTAPNLTYISTSSYSGSDSFTYKASYASVDSGTATVSITVTPPTTVEATNLTVSANSAQPVNVTLSASVENGSGGSLSYTVLTQPAHGTLTGSAPDLVYTSAAGYSGADSFTYQASYGSTTSSPATVSITVVAPTENHVPTITSGPSVSTLGTVSVSLTVTATDADGDALTYSWAKVSGAGTVTFSASTSASTTASFSDGGTYSLSVTVSDGKASTSGTVSAYSAIPTSTVVVTTETFVGNLYTDLLGRNPDTSGFGSWTTGLQAGTVSGNDVVTSILFSQEATQVSTSDEEFIRQCYASYFGRIPSPDEVNAWLPYIQNGMSRQVVAQNFGQSVEFGTYCTTSGFGAYTQPVVPPGAQTDFINGLYTNLLGRPADNTGCNNFLDLFGTQGSSAITSFFNSQEFLNSTSSMTDTQFITALYEGVLGRAPDAAGLDYWVSGLQNGFATRQIVANQFVQSIEYTNRITTVFSPGN